MAEIIEKKDGDQEEDVSETDDRQTLDDLTLLDDGGVGLDDIDPEEQGSNDDEWAEPNASSSLATIHTGSRPTDYELFANMIPEGEMIIEEGETLPTSEAAGQPLPSVDEPDEAPEGPGRGPAPEQRGPEDGPPQEQNAAPKQTPASPVPPAEPAKNVEPVVRETDPELEPAPKPEPEPEPEPELVLELEIEAAAAERGKDTAIELDIDPAGTAEIIIGNVPIGATLSAGINNNDGTWTITADEVDGLTLMPAENSDADFTLTVSGDGVPVDLPVTVNADAATATSDYSIGQKDTAIALDIDPNFGDADGTETLSITIAKIPSGATLNYVDGNGDTQSVLITNGTAELTADQLNGLTITPEVDCDNSFDLSVTATSTEAEGNDFETTSGTMTVDVAAVADDAFVGTQDGFGTEDQLISLDIMAASDDDITSVIISGVPTDAVLSSGIDNEDGLWTLTGDQLGVSVTTTESNTGDTSTSTTTLDVSVSGVAYAPELTVFLGEGAEISSSLTPVSYWKLDETGGNDTLVDSVGDNDGSPINNLRDMDGGEGGNEAVFATAAGLKGVGSERDQEYIEVDDSPDLKPDNGTLTLWFDADEVDGSFALASSDAQGLTTDGGFNLRIEDGQLTLEIEDENGVHRIEGGSVDDGDWNQVSASWGEEGMHLYLNGEEVASDKSFTGGLSGNDNPWIFGATAGSESGESGEGRLSEFFDGHLDDIAIYDMQISDDQASDLYDNGVQVVIDNGGDVDFVQFPLDVTASLTEIDGSDSLSIMIHGLPDDAALSSGTDNGDGSWSVHADDLEGLMVTVLLGSDDFSMTVSATATDEGGDTQTATEIVPVEGDGFTADVDVIDAGAGNDNIDAGAGDDIVMAGDGDDTVASGDGDDIIDGGAGNDRIDSGAGDDLFIFGAGDGSDYFNGGDGWSDTVQLEGVDSGHGRDSGWAVQVEGGVGDIETENGIEFVEEVAGSITLSDGSEWTFDGVEKLEW